MKLTVIRHGETDWNVLKKVQGQADIPLNRKGIEQANNLKKMLETEKFEKIISSPLLRAKQTAEILFKDKEIIYDDRLKERDFGEFEGLKTNQFNSEDFWSYKKDLIYKRAENIKTFFSRINNFLTDIETKYKNENILIVAHTGTIIAIDSFFYGIPGDDNFFKNNLRNCEVFKYYT